MVISYRIPHGHMRIEAGVFFQQAAKPKIKRMFKQLHASSPPQETVDEIRKWLYGQSAIAGDNEVEAARLYVINRDMLAQSEELYERMGSPCDGLYTRDKDMLDKARNRVSSYKLECRRLLSDVTDAKQIRERYVSIIAEMDKIFSM